MDEQIFTALANLGFPALICAYLIVRVNQTLQSLTNAINLQIETNRAVAEKVNALEHKLAEIKKNGGIVYRG